MFERENIKGAAIVLSPTKYRTRNTLCYKPYCKKIGGGPSLNSKWMLRWHLYMSNQVSMWALSWLSSKGWCHPRMPNSGQVAFFPLLWSRLRSAALGWNEVKGSLTLENEKEILYWAKCSLQFWMQPACSHPPRRPGCCCGSEVASCAPDIVSGLSKSPKNHAPVPALQLGRPYLLPWNLYKTLSSASFGLHCP